ncbi:MAG: hypothetical protein V2B18_12955 [Pseudomonadota bacterium]
MHELVLSFSVIDDQTHAGEFVTSKKVSGGKVRRRWKRKKKLNPDRLVRDAKVRADPDPVI